MSDRKVSGALQERIARLNASQAAGNANEPKALPPGGLSKLRSKFEGAGDAPLIPKGSFGLGAPSAAPDRGSADRNRIASAASPRAVSPNPSPKPASRVIGPSTSNQGSERSASPVPSSGVPETTASIETNTSSTTTASSHARAPSEASSVASSPASSVARSGFPGGLPARLTQDLLQADPPGMRTPMSVSSMNVETGSVGSARHMTDESVGGDITPPQLHTPSASAHDDTHLSGDIAELSLDVNAGSPPHSPPRGAFLSGVATPTSTVGSGLDDRAREEATERQLEAYENEEHDRARSPDPEEDEDRAVSPRSPDTEEQRIRHVPLTAHEAAHDAHPAPITDTDASSVRLDPPAEEVRESSLVSTVPGNALAAAQPPSKPDGNKSPPPDEQPPAHSRLSMTVDQPEVDTVIPLEPPAAADAGDVEALTAEGGVKADADTLAAMTGHPAVAKPDDDDGRGDTDDILDAYDDNEEEAEPKVKCSDCHVAVPLSELGEHTCQPARSPPAQSVPSDHGLETSPGIPSSSTFGQVQSLDAFVSQPHAASSVPEDVDLDLDDDLEEVLASPSPRTKARHSRTMALDSPPITSATPDFPPAQATAQVPDDVLDSPSDSPLNSDFPHPPASSKTSPTIQRTMHSSAEDRRASSDSGGSTKQRKTATLTSAPRDYDESDEEYTGGTAWVSTMRHGGPSDE